MKDNYYDIKAISNSSLSWLKESPRTFKENMNNKSEERESKSLKSGKLIHSFILEPDTFAVSNVTPVEGMLGTFIQELVNIEQNGTVKEEEKFKIAYNKAGFKLSLEAVLKNFSKENSQDFYKFLLNTQNKVCLTEQEFNMINNCKQNLINHKKSNALLFNDFILSKDNEIIIEKGIEFEIDDIKCKAKPDKIIINHKNKTVDLIDLKTTNKNVNKFYNSYSNYGYGRQLAFYKQALLNTRKLEGYTFNFYIIVVQTNKFNEVAVFKLTEKQIEDGKLQYQQLIELYKNHLKYGFDYPLEYYMSSDGAVELKEEDVYDNTDIKEV